jgi:hypothetical protein
MNSEIKIRPLLCLTAILLSPTIQAQTAVPEPGVIVYGKVLASDGVTTLPATALTVQLRFRQSDDLSKTQVSNATVGLGLNSKTYYSAQIAFSNPAALDSTTPTAGTFAFTDAAGAKTYDLTSQGSGVTSSGTLSAITTPNNPTPSFTFPQLGAQGGDARGLMVSMDIQTTIAPPSNTFTNYMAGYPALTGADATETADPDGDQMSNEAEWLFGTDPTNTDSNKALHTLVVNIAPVGGEPNSRSITFTPKYTNGSRTYRIFSTTDLGESVAWQPAANIPVTDGADIVPGLIAEGEAKDESAIPAKKFYKIEAKAN